MALFVLVAVGIVVVQTWLDWRDSRKNWVLPDWAKGLALGGAVTVCMSTAASYATVWLQDPSSNLSSGPLASTFWPELAFLACVMGGIVAALRKKRMGLGIFLAGAILVGFWLGTALLS